jgi:hypothetical protein
LLNDVENYKRELEQAIKKLSTLSLYKLDCDVKALEKAFEIVYDLGIFNIHEYDSSLHDELKLELFSKLTPLSGSLSFLAVQILAANRIMQSNGFKNASSYYKKRCGIIINHLRAPVTVIDSTKSERGYLLSGTLSWASGYKIFDSLVVGFHHKGVEMQAVMPFNVEQGCMIGEPDETFVGVSMNTVSIELDKYEVLEEAIINSQAIGSYTKQKSISKTVHFALYGIGLGAIDALDDEDLKNEASKRLELQKERFLTTVDGTRMDELRIELFELVQKIITTGMVLHGGKSMLSSKRLQQYYRELIMFNSNGLNVSIKELFKRSFLDNF